MNVKILYVLDQDSSGVGGPFPDMFVFHTDVNPDAIWETFCTESMRRGLDTNDFLNVNEHIDSLRERLLDGYDVQAENQYWNLVTEPVRR